MADRRTTRETVIPTMCASHCGGSCLLKVHVQDGVITRVETDDGEEPQLRGCMRGRALRQRVYAPNRVLYPMKRTGERGEGKFERISWDEALDKVAGELKRVKENYGPEAILCLPLGGDLSTLHTGVTLTRLLALAGGFTTWWGTTSFHGGIVSSYYTYGTIHTSNTRDDLLNSRLIVLWGWDPASTTTGTNTAWFIARAKERGTRIVAVDPHLSDTAAIFADQWIPIRPGTDAAMLIAMAYVMIEEKLQDQAFLNTYTIGFELFRDYVTGAEDGIPKTPGWAESITGVSAGVIEMLAREYATTKPGALMAGIGPGRTAYGEQYHRAISTLAVMAGNVGVHGGDAAGRAWESVVGGYPYGEGMGTALEFVRNPIEKRKPGSLKAPFGEVHPRIHYAKVADALLTGKKGGYPADYKMVFMANTNFLNSMPNTNKIARALKVPEFIAVAEQYLNATARYADILLPTASYVERDDIAMGVGMAYVGFQNQVIEPLGECKPHNEIAKALAKRMGITGYDEKTGEERLKAVAQRLSIPDYQAFRRKGVHWISKGEPYVAFRKQIEDPERNPFPTPSGKIEIFSQRMADVGNPLLPPIPKYIEPWEGMSDPLAQKYPIQVLTNHAKRRANAQFDTFPWLKENLPQAVMMNAADAHDRKIHDGELVRVFNDRGETIVPARVTHRILPGAAILPEGAWYCPDEQGIDRGGCANVLTKDEISPAGCFAYNTALVQIERL